VSRTILAGGITTVRDAAGADAGIKRAVADGLVPGPRLQISLTLLSQTGGHGDGWFASGQEVRFWPVYPGMPDGLVDGPVALRRKVRELVRAGADVIKAAVRAGIRSIEHGAERPPADAGGVGGAEHPARGRGGEGEHQQQGGLVDRALHGHGVAGDGGAAGEDALVQGGVARPERRAGSGWGPHGSGA
jgi:hypothetical protein